MKKQFIYDESGIRTGVILSIDDYNALLLKHQNSMESIKKARAKLDAYLEFYSLDSADLEKFKVAMQRRADTNY
jgi:hypothetical protein